MSPLSPLPWKAPAQRGVRPRMSAAAGLAAAAAAALLPALPAAASAPSSDGSWSVVPSAGGGTRPARDGRPYFYVEGVAGTVLEDKVSVVNPGARPLTVRLRGADADNTRSGGLAVRVRARDTGAWITFAERTVQIPARTRAEVPFTVSVPANAVPGDHPGAIVATADGRESGVRIALRVAGPTLSALTVEHVRVHDKRISYDLVNRGNTVLTPRLAVHANGVLGTLLDRRPRTLPVELLPGRRITRTEPWPDAPSLDSVHVTLTVTASDGTHATGRTTARFVPWGAVAGTAAGLVLLTGGAARVVRRRGRSTGRGEAPDTERELTAVGTGEAL